MRRNGLLVVACLVCLLTVGLVGTPAWADHHEAPEGQAPEMDPAMMEAWMRSMTPGEQHEHLASMAGDYDITVKSWMDPSAEPMVMEGTATREMVHGGRHLKEYVESNMMGQPFEGTGMTGFDNVTGKYWSTWIDNMSTGLMTLHGKMDESMGAMVWEGELSDPMTGGMKQQKVVSKIDDSGKEVSEFYEIKDGKEVKMMEITYVPK